MDTQRVENKDIGRKSGGKGILLRASITLSALTILSRILGLGRDSLIAIIFGVGGITDAFFVALRIPNAFRRMVAEGSLSTASVPLLSRAREHSGIEFSRTLTTLVALSLLITVPITLLGISYSRELVLLLSPGLGTQEDLVETASLLLKILMPFLIMVSLSAVYSSALNSLHRYAGSALPPIILNLSMLSGLLLLYLSGEHRIWVLAWCFLVGSIISLIPLILELKVLGYPLTFALPESKKALERFFLLFVPSLLSSSANQILMLLTSLLASMLPVGSISCLYYADRLYQLPLGVFSVALATAALPRLTELRGEHQEFSAELTQILGWAIIAVFPAQIGLYMLSEPIVRLIYEHGNFSSSGAAGTASALRGYTFGLLPVTLQAILVRAYLAKGYGRIPAVSTLLATIITPLIALSLMGEVSSSAGNALALIINTLQVRLHVSDLGIHGLALSGGIGMAFAALLLFLLLTKAKISLQGRDLFFMILESAIAGGVLAIAITNLLGVISNLTVLVLAAVPLGILTYGTAIYILHYLFFGVWLPLKLPAKAEKG